MIHIRVTTILGEIAVWMFKYTYTVYTKCIREKVNFSTIVEERPLSDMTSHSSRYMNSDESGRDGPNAYPGVLSFL